MTPKEYKAFIKMMKTKHSVDLSKIDRHQLGAVIAYVRNKSYNEGWKAGKVHQKMMENRYPI